ncbi:E3 ubiquitin-protein ligase MARCHF9-like [Lethenteron reissneri]|uniref:E3 ubiquitin-protein ligase MARCHF9-like n=1 Tax=Lethenteron reissneri TaxID=7753 RepID=UPI002AB628E5|nr:E3 ubiquitin-protein ligase MARCHF9-like [Lethenteron reissneri]
MSCRGVEEPSEGDRSRQDAGSLGTGSRTPPICRICFQGPEQGLLLSPCRCAGSVRFSHQRCLLQWTSERGSWSCELCGSRYRALPARLKGPLQWRAVSLSVVERVQVSAVVLGAVFLCASLAWLLWSAFSPAARWQRMDPLFRVCYAMYACMDLVCIGLIVHEGPSVRRVVRRWLAVNQHWRLLDYDKARAVEDENPITGPPARPPALPGPIGAVRSPEVSAVVGSPSRASPCAFACGCLGGRVCGQHGQEAEERGATTTTSDV